MIGHVFSTSGATCLALAPSADRPDEYIVMARTENGYAVANVLTSDLGKIGGPTSWLRAGYYDRGNGSDEDLNEAAEQFAKDIGCTDVTTLVAHIEQAQQIVEHRTHLVGQG